MNYLYYDYINIWQSFNHSGNLKDITKIIKEYLKKHEFEVDKNGNILIGNFNKKRPCLVAHIDSVHSKRSTKFYFNKGILSSNNGIGGDDKCGIVAILEILAICKDINAILTVDEELGGIGASNIDKKVLKNIQYFIEIDRKDNKDVIFVSGMDNMASDNFKNDLKPYMKRHKFFENTGTFTDINILTQYAEKSGINVSAGYYNPHTVKEYVNMYDLYKAILFVKDVLNNLKKDYPLDVTENIYYNESQLSAIEEVLELAYMNRYNDNMINLILRAYEIGQNENKFSWDNFESSEYKQITKGIK